ncbi:uncharacterized protein HD556DRAFT_1435996 [Suillus plorans]|uniref:Uncharacterized protein n=1 Tax=Suillus plorans TaxID=116603 RepID=A0A9P7E3J4_9AGAM|nr:uncharacterized protein HD556DRAFT_1435996 [Suillus plorans]KAG1810284.1 hypothetical protein HD556DRAFT_1435996 [Suillus plorans]
MPPVRPRVQCSEQLKMLLQRLTNTPMAIQMQPAHGTRERGTITHGTRGHGVAATSASAATSYGDAPTSGISKIRWETPNCNQMSAFVTYLSTHPANHQILFYKGKKFHPSDDSLPSGSDKGKIHAVIAKHIFKKDEMYQLMYAEDQTKFTQAVGNCLTYLKGKYKTHCARFKQTGTGVNPEEPGAAVNLLVQVLSDFPWYEDLDDIWRDNSAYAAKTFLAKEKEKPLPLPINDPDDPMIIIDNAPNTHDVEDKHIDSAEDHPPAVNDYLPHDTMDPVIDSFTMGEELNYDEQDITMQEDQGKVECEEALTIQQSLSNKCLLSSPSPPHMHTCNHSSLGTFKTHADCVMGHGLMRSPKPPSSVALSSMKTMICSTSLGLSTPSSSSHQQTILNNSGAKKSHLGKNIGSKVRSVCEKVKTLTNNMLYIYTVKAATFEYKITKVNALCQKYDLDFQCKKAQLKYNKAVIVHQCCQESKTFDLQVLEAQAKVHAERKAALQLKIELLKLKGGVAD